jgi:hypothetical protein
MSGPTHAYVRRALVLLAGAGAGLALTACGGASADPSAASETSKERQTEQRLTEFARCMREHGVHVETHSGNGGREVGIAIKGGPGSGGPQTVETANNACKKYQPEPQKVNLSPQQKVEQEERVRKFASCMREHGVQVHASASEGRVSIQVGGPPGSGGPNPRSPTFQKAQETCHGLLPGKRGLGPPGGVPSRSSAGGEEEGASAAGG